MVPFLKEVVKTGGELSVDERNLLTTAFNNVFGTRRASWRIISSIEQNELRGNEKHTATIRGYRIKIENELEKICRDVLGLLDESLIPNASTGESKALYYKMHAYFTGLLFSRLLGLTPHIFRKGDYSRYLAEFVSGEKHNLAVTSAYKAYEVGSKSVGSEFSRPRCTDQRFCLLLRLLPVFLRQSSRPLTHCGWAWLSTSLSSTTKS
jgi:14-3-3 protein epsilon